MTRRSLFVRGAVGTALLSVGGLAAVAFRGTRLVEVPTGLKVLDAGEYSVLMALAARLIPTDGEFPSAQDVGVGKRVDRVLSTFHEGNKTEIKQGIALFEGALPGLILDLRPTPFTQLDASAQVRALEAWRDSRIPLRRSVYKVLRSLVLAAYYSAPKTYEAIGYPGPPEIAS